MILLNLDRTNKVPLFHQVFAQLKLLIEANTLKPGFRMPPTRELAKNHGVNRSTVYKAYEELTALGYLESRPGSYSTVRKRHKIATEDQRAKKGLIPWAKNSSEEGRTLHNAFERFKSRLPENINPSNLVNLASLELDTRNFPVEAFRRCINTVMVEKGGQLLTYGDCAGYKPLREYIAQRLRFHGISVNYDEILITNGSQNAIELVLKLLTVPNKNIAVEMPTYSNVIPLLNYFKANIVGIPMNETGMDLDHLEKVLQNQDVSFIYTMPNFHNPTGITTDQTHREKLLGLCETYRVPLVEDAFEEEMKYFGKVPLPIKSMDRLHMVIYLGTFSKVLFPGIRIGWVAAEKEFIERVTAIKKFSDLSTNSLIQAALHEFCEQGYYTLHIKRMHREYRKRMNTVIGMLREKLSRFQHVSWTEPAGGYLLWLQLRNTGKNEKQLTDLFYHYGLILIPGSHFFPPRPEQAQTHQFRLSISTCSEPEIREGITRLANALSDIYCEKGENHAA